MKNRKFPPEFEASHRQDEIVRVTKEIEAIRIKDRLTMLEAVGEYCNINDLEPDELLPFLNGNIIAAIRSEAISGNMVKRNAVSELPLD